MPKCIELSLLRKVLKPKKPPNSPDKSGQALKGVSPNYLIFNQPFFKGLRVFWRISYQVLFGVESEIFPELIISNVYKLLIKPATIRLFKKNLNNFRH